MEITYSNGMKIISNASEVDIDLIPEHEFKEFAHAVLEMTERVMSMPGAQERYEKWLKERGEKLI